MDEINDLCRPENRPARTDEAVRPTVMTRGSTHETGRVISWQWEPEYGDRQEHLNSASRIGKINALWKRNYLHYINIIIDIFIPYHKL